MKEQLQEQWHFFINERGEPEAVNSHTGEIAKRNLPVGDDMDKYHRIRIQGEDYWVPQGDESLPVPERQYNTLGAERFCSYLVEGRSLLEACHKAGISYYTLCKWRRLYPEFREMIEQAKEDRAELIFEELLHVAKETGEDKDEVALGRLRADIYKHVSAVGSDKFNPKSKVDLATTVGIKIVDTGIQREREVTGEEAEIFERIAESQARAVQSEEDK